MTTSGSRLFASASQSPRTNKRDVLVLAVGRAWRFHPQNGCEIARALGSPFKINGRINSRGSREQVQRVHTRTSPFPSRRPHANFPSSLCVRFHPRVFVSRILADDKNATVIPEFADASGQPRWTSAAQNDVERLYGSMKIGPPCGANVSMHFLQTRRG